jgi:two-component system OmpR family sensor kinase
MDPEVRERIVRELRETYRREALRHHPWDRVLGEVMGRRPGWHQRVHFELRLHYGAHLHRRLFLWFGATIFCSVIVTGLAAHLGRAWLATHPWRSVLLFGIPALWLWAAAGRIARRLARPLYELTRVAQEIGGGNVGARVSAQHMGFDEIGVLSTAFNDMAARLERQLAEQRELLAAVSHELRTPLARIRLLVEIARQAERNADARTLDEIEREAIEIDALVGELLASARIEFQAFTPKPLDAAEAARRAVERAGEDAGKLRIDGGPFAFSGDPTLIARALANLIDNARKHGGGLDQLAVRGGAERVVFEVADRGPGFPPGEEARVFERFYRAPGSASADAESVRHSSLGLGLALVRRIAEAHGGTASATNRPGGGACITLTVPVSPA